jgi:hypothetical protein
LVACTGYELSLDPIFGDVFGMDGVGKAHGFGDVAEMVGWWLEEVVWAFRAEYQLDKRFGQSLWIRYLR